MSHTVTLKVAIIGCGYVGVAVARHWRKQGFTVTATTTTPEKAVSLGAIAQQVCILRGEDVRGMEALLAQQDVVLVSVGSPNREAYDATYVGTAQTLANVLPRCPQVKQVIYSSSFAVYGDYQGQWVDEETPLRATTPNAQTLAKAEQILLQAQTPTRMVCILRLGGIYGPERELERIYRRVAGTTRPGTGTEAANWVHLDDIVGAIDFTRQKGLKGIYNVVQDSTLTVGEIIAQVGDRHNFAPVQWDPSQPSTRAHNVRVSNQKIKAAGYEFIHPRMVI